VNVIIVFRIPQGVSWGVGLWYTLYGCDLLATETILEAKKKLNFDAEL